MRDDTLIVRRALCLSLFLFVCSGKAIGQGGVCPISADPVDSSRWADEAKCLLRTVRMDRKLGAALPNLPAPLDRLVGSSDVIDKGVLNRYLTEHNIKAVGRVRYFVIHDTSSPNYERGQFPARSTHT